MYLNKLFIYIRHARTKRFIAAYKVAAASFCPVECIICGFDQVSGTRAKLGNHRGTSSRDRDDLVGDSPVLQPALAKCAPDFIRDPHGPILGGIGQNDGELFAAEAGHDISRARNYIHCRFSNLLQAAVAPQVPVSVVVELEKIVSIQETTRLTVWALS